MKLLNLGCGSTYHEAWTNVDLISTSPAVIAADLRAPLPYPDSSFDAVYHSHVLEHFEKADAERFLSECLRVLKPGGIIRVVVPDLEGIARTYLEKLELAAKGEGSACYDYDWILLELLDQMVRSRSGGYMKAWIEQPVVPNEGFVLDRIGQEYVGLRKRLAAPAAKESPLKRLWRKSPGSLIRIAWKRLIFLLVWALAGRKTSESLANGAFRQSGEVHQWMYDRFSLGRLLRKLGANSVKICAADESSIPAFASYQLDSNEGKPRKPDSLYLEATK